MLALWLSLHATEGPSERSRLRLDTDIWVYALIRRANLGGASAVVARKGDARGGAVLVKLVNARAGTVRLLSEATRGDGERVWMEPSAATDEADLDAYIARTARFDPDLWVVEIDDPEGRHFLTEPVELR
jgi:hypothetical protein